MPLSRATTIGGAGLVIVFALLAAAQFQTLAASGAASGAAAGEAHATRGAIHRVVIQVTQNDPAVMNLALNNAENLVTYYKGKGEKVDVELVAYGAGLNMVRSDTSPVKDRLAAISGKMKNVTFSGCGNTLSNQSRLENKTISLVPEAHIVTAGIARIVDLQEQGWTYVRP